MDLEKNRKINLKNGKEIIELQKSKLESLNSYKNFNNAHLSSNLKPNLNEPIQKIFPVDKISNLKDNKGYEIISKNPNKENEENAIKKIIEERVKRIKDPSNLMQPKFRQETIPE